MYLNIIPVAVHALLSQFNYNQYTKVPHL